MEGSCLFVRLSIYLCRLARPEGWLAGPQTWLDGPEGGMDGQTDGWTNKRKIAPFYRTLSPIAAFVQDYKGTTHHKYKPIKARELLTI